MCLLLWISRLDQICLKPGSWIWDIGREWFLVHQLSEQMPRTLARWLKRDLASCDCEIESLNTQAAVSTAGTLLSSLNGRRYEGGWGNNGTLSKELLLLLPCLASNYHQHHPNTQGDA